MIKETLYLIATLDLLAQIFDMDHEKVAHWMNTENPFLGESKPSWFWCRGRGHKVYQFVSSCYKENQYD